MAYLEKEDLVPVRTFLLNVRLKWYDIGLELGVKEIDLEEIKLQYGNKSAECLREMIKKWLKFFPDRPTWGKLATALEAPAVDEPELALAGKTARPHSW
jgi:hypothetical protein